MRIVIMDAYANWRLSTTTGIKYKRIEGPTFDYEDLEKFTAQEKVLVRASDLEAFMLFCIPPIVTDPTYGTAYPPPRVKLAGATGLYCQSISAEPFDSGKPGDPLQSDVTASSGTYADLYVCTLKFSPSAYGDATGSDPLSYIEQEVSFETEVLQLSPAKSSVTKGSGSQDSKTPYDPVDPLTPNTDKETVISMIVPNIRLTLKNPFILNPNWPTILTMAGKVNSTVSPLFLNAEKQTVLFKGFTASRNTYFKDRTGSVKPWNFTFTFSIRRIEQDGKIYGWNHTPSPVLQSMVYVIYWGTSTTYKLADLTQLFS